MSTSTSAKHAPCTPEAARLELHSPLPVTPAEGRAEQACFHVMDFPPPVTFAPSKLTSSGLTPPKSGETFSATANRAFIAAFLTAGASDAVVVEPPELFASPNLELPIFSTTSFC